MILVNGGWVVGFFGSFGDSLDGNRLVLELEKRGDLVFGSLGKVWGGRGSGLGFIVIGLLKWRFRC